MYWDDLAFQYAEKVLRHGHHNHFRKMKKWYMPGGVRSCVGYLAYFARALLRWTYTSKEVLL